MPTRDAVLELLSEIPDPEMPISIVDLGIVARVAIDNATVTVDILPTFVGCPALPMIQNDIIEKLGALPDVKDVRVNFIFDPPWSVDRITDLGRESLREHGVTVPLPGAGAGEGVIQAMLQQVKRVHLRTSAILCPFCGSNRTRLDSAFGPTRCRMIYYCDACRNSFEHLKRV
jgi:ring-1,2-phenylacetyl-CoA epoxidase subunit PaaD